MNNSDPSRFSTAVRCLLLLGVLLVPRVVQAQWHAVVGAQSHDKGHQAMAFLPNEIWIQEGDSITWTSRVDEIHTVTFLKNGQVRPPFNGPTPGCPGFTTISGTFDGSACLSTPPLLKGATFTVTFPTKGNYRLVCLVHPDMTGLVHVLDPATPLPHNQDFYDDQAADHRKDLLSAIDVDDDHDGDHDGDHDHHSGRHGHLVVAGVGNVTATAGGKDSLSVMRFLSGTIIIRAGQTVEWVNEDPDAPHTITFGTEPAGDPFPPSANVTVDADGARHVVLNSPADSAHSGFIVAPPQERTGLVQTPPPPTSPTFTRLRVTFTHAGTYPYICALHDELGMKGKVIVIP